MSILKFSHDRTADFNEESKKIYKVIEGFGDNKYLQPLLNHFEKRYFLPEEIIKKRIKKLIALNYNYKSAKFDESLKISHTLYSTIKTILSYLKLTFCTTRDKKVNNYKLIIDDIRDDLQLMRFEKLINLVGINDTLIVANYNSVDRNKFPDYNIHMIDWRRYNNYNQVISKVIINELLFGIWICIKSSILLRINLVPIYKSIIDVYYHYKCLFDFNKAEYLIQERHYSTNPIKNYLFKKSGGSTTASIQKNLIENDHLFYYIDIDYMFTLGQKTIDITFEYGARIDKIIPVGSLFMEESLQNRYSEKEKNIDVLMLGINTMNAYERLDKYTEFMNDYYESIRWLVKFKKEYPSYRIGIKHHSSAGRDIIENKITLDSGIEILPKEQNSYELAFESRCIVTWGSTMGYEMNGHGVPSFFIDPGKRNTFLYDLRNKKFQHLLLDNYDDYQNYLVSTIGGLVNKDYEVDLPKNLCLDSHNVSKKIYKTFCN